MNLITEKLKVYYQKHGRRIIFRNRMSLNELAMAMWERLDYQGFDTSVLSRVLKGERLFTLRQLEVFCEVLGIEEKERRRLETSLTSAILKRHHVRADNYAIASFLKKEKAEKEIVTVKRPFYRKFPYVISILYLAVFLWWLKLQPNLNKSELDSWGILQNFIPLVAGVYALRLAFKKFGGWKNNLGRSVIFFALGLLSAWFGMETWAFYNIFLKIQVPYPSWADLGFFSVIPLYTLGIFYFARACGVKFTWSEVREKWPALGIPIIMLAFYYALFFREVTVDLSHPLKTFLDFAYPLGDIVPITLALITLVMIEGIHRSARERIFYIIFAFKIQYLADYIFLYQAGKGIYHEGGLVDLTYSTAYLLMGLTLYSFNNYDRNYAYRLSKLIHSVKDKTSQIVLFLNKLRIFLPI